MLCKISSFGKDLPAEYFVNNISIDPSIWPCYVQVAQKGENKLPKPQKTSKIISKSYYKQTNKNKGMEDLHLIIFDTEKTAEQASKAMT